MARNYLSVDDLTPEELVGILELSGKVKVAELGAHPLVISSSELQLGRGETIEDTGRVLSRYVDAIVLRTFEQERLEVLAAAASVPVVNALSDFEHPCQALADLF